MRNGKLILLVWMLSLFIPQIGLSQTAGYSEDELPILVKRLYQWSKDYLTVTNNWNGMLVTVESGECPSLLSVITEINGKSTKGMTEDEFYFILMSNSRSDLTFMKKSKGEIKAFECTLSYHKHLYWQGGLNLEWPEDFPANVNYTVDRRVEFFKYLTFDCVSNSNSEIDENAIFNVISRRLKGNGLEKVSENPDLIIKMDFTQEEGNSVTCAIYVLDAKDNNEVWRLEYSGLRGNIDKIFNVIKANIGEYIDIFPFVEPTYSYKLTTVGVAFESRDDMYTGKILYVLPGCDAYNKGLRSGDTVLKGYLGGSCYIFSYFGRRTWFKAGKKQGCKNFTFNIYGPIPFPTYRTNNVENFLVAYELTDGFNKNHFKIQKSNGSKILVDAPMDVQTYRYMYIR